MASVLVDFNIAFMSAQRSLCAPHVWTIRVPFLGFDGSGLGLGLCLKVQVIEFGIFHFFN